jgi:hypothetical protein
MSNMVQHVVYPFVAEEAGFKNVEMKGPDLSKHHWEEDESEQTDALGSSDGEVLQPPADLLPNLGQWKIDHSWSETGAPWPSNVPLPGGSEGEVSEPEDQEEASKEKYDESTGNK